jgi:hypothetical protein
VTPEGTLREVLARVAARRGFPALILQAELDGWPAAAVAAMKEQGLLTRTSPAVSTVCPGCEDACRMPVEILPDPREPAAFIVCDRRDDINRVPVPPGHLEQWAATGQAIAGMLARLLGLYPPEGQGPDPARWEVGLLKGTEHSAHLVLLAQDGLSLSLAGHTIPLADVLTLESDRITVDRRTLIRLVNQPAAGGGDRESAAQRRARLKQLVAKEKAKGNKAFLKVVAEREGISVSTLKGILTKGD